MMPQSNIRVGSAVRVGIAAAVLAVGLGLGRGGASQGG
ncbi:MAG: hypothetical protein JWO31_3682, partial [Phycisphaerales bacterium]|nr:hypothetical protein [Phycisphaerales bacterium]